MNKSISSALLAFVLMVNADAACAGGKKKPRHNGGHSNLKESFRTIGHGFRDAGRAVGRDAKAGAKAVKRSEKRK